MPDTKISALAAGAPAQGTDVVVIARGGLNYGLLISGILALFRSYFWNVAGTFASVFANTNTAARTYTFQDKDYTVADDADLATKAAIAAAQTFTGAQRGSFVRLADAATIAWNMAASNQFVLTLGGNRTMGVPTGIVKGQQGELIVWQDMTGSRSLAFPWMFQKAGGIAIDLSTPGCSRDMVVYATDEYATSAVTITIATPGVVSWVAHGLDNGQQVQLTTTGALPTGLSANTTYFVTNAAANDFSLATTLANAAAGTKIATSGSQSGVHTMVAASISISRTKAWS